MKMKIKTPQCVTFPSLYLEIPISHVGPGPILPQGVVIANKLKISQVSFIRMPIKRKLRHLRTRQERSPHMNKIRHTVRALNSSTLLDPCFLPEWSI